MDVGFARFDVVVEVVAESLDVRDDFLAACGCKVAGKQNCGLSCQLRKVRAKIMVKDIPKVT